MAMRVEELLFQLVAVPVVLQNEFFLLLMKSPLTIRNYWSANSKRRCTIILSFLLVVWTINWMILSLLWSRRLDQISISSSGSQDEKRSSDDTWNRSIHMLLKSKRNVESNHKELPAWIVNYVTWHNHMRAKFPGHKIFTDENAPPVLIRTCMMDYLCGGVHERLGQLPWDLYLANQTNRILFIWWENPLLEGYLIPIALLDWSIPPAVKKRPPKMFEEGILEDWNQQAENWDKKVKG